MSDHKDVQLKIASIVSKWELENYAVFFAFMEQRKAKTDTLADKFASLHKGNGYVERLIHEIPELLHLELGKGLAEDELKFFTSKEGALWFAKTFPQYRVAQLV